MLSEDLSQQALVGGFLPELGLVSTPIVSVALAYDDPVSYTTYILIFHQGLIFEGLERNLLCPFQMRMNDIIVNDSPLTTLLRSKQLKDLPSTAHSIISLSPPLQIPLRLRGTMSYFETRKPTLFEIEHPDQYPQIEMTYSMPQWDPYDVQFSMTEEKLREQLGLFPDTDMRKSDRELSALNSISVVYEETEFLTALIRSVNVSSVSASSSTRRKGTVTAEELAKRWHIGIELAKKTIERTTQLGVRDFTHSKGTRRLRHSNQQLRYRRLNCAVYTDTMFAPWKSLQGNKCAQVYVTDFHWTKAYPIGSKAEAHYTLDLLHQQYGVFHTMIPDNAMELTHGEFLQKARRAGSIIHPVEAYTPNQNRAESAIRELKRMYRRAMNSSGAPRVLWDLCIELQAEIRSHTALDLFALSGDVPGTVLTGDTTDISHLCQFAWYDFVWFINPLDSMDNRQLGRYCGPSYTVGDVMCSKVLNEKGNILVRSSVFPFSVEDLNSEVVKQRCADYQERLKRALGNRVESITVDDDLNQDEFETPTFEPYEDDEEAEPTMPEADDMDHDAYDKYISARLILPDSEGIAQSGRVKRRKRDEDGKLIGKSNANPILDTSLYEVEFEDGRVGTYAANIIAENIYEQVDDEGFTYTLFDAIVDHLKGDDAVPADEGFTEFRGRKYPKRTTRGWKLCVQWKDGSTSWVALKDLKESHPIQVAEYAVINNLVHEPAFHWWVSHTLKKRERIIKAAQTRYMRTNQKFGIELPHNVKRALEIDAETGTTYWRDAIRKEMATISPVIDILDENASAPVGYQCIPCHMVFDVKMDFTRKARFVAGGHVTEPPSSITYASVVSRESVRIAFLLAALNDLDILSADVQGAYLNAPCREKVYTICGPEFGEYKGRIGVIVKALYGLRSSGYAWHAHMAETLREMGFEMCVADNDVWMRPATTEDGIEYYEYVLIHTDDLLAVSKKPLEILNCIDQHYILKPSSIGKPTQYLGSQIGEFRLPDQPEKVRWSMSSEKYVKEAIRNVQSWLEEHNLPPLKSKATSVLPTGYRPELDASDYCDEELAHYYMQQVGVLRWAVELGRINITAEVSMMAAFSAAPRIGHFQALMHIFAFLHHHPRCRLVFDDSYVQIDDGEDKDWRDFYPNASEDLPPNAPKARGKPVQMIVFVDSDHAGDLLTRRSRTGVLMFLNRSPILWYSKKQASIEPSTFGSEFTALKVATDLIKGMRYKLRMMGVPLDGPAHVRVDNMSVVKNTTIPESVLKKKSNSIAYHYVRENVAGGTMKIGYEPSGTNLADMLTKTQSGPQRKRLADMVLF